MKGTDKSLAAMPLFFVDDARGAMATNIMERANFVILIAYYHCTLIRHLEALVVTGPLQVGYVGDKHPVTQEQLFHFEFCQFIVVVSPGGQTFAVACLLIDFFCR